MSDQRPVLEYFSPQEVGERRSWRRGLAAMASLILVMVGVVLMLVGAASCWQAEVLGPAPPPERSEGRIACGVVVAIGLVIAATAGRCFHVAFRRRTKNCRSDLRGRCAP